MKNLLESFEKTNRRENLIQKNDRILVALSGGPDSTALLWILGALRRKFNLKIFAGHLNHGYLAKKSGEYERVARAQARDLGIPFHSKKIRVRKSARSSGRSVEEAGRIARYDFLTKLAKKISADKIATAHTLDDQAETVLLNLVRGSGIRGLSGIPIRRPVGDRVIIRPFLFTAKKDILAFLHKYKHPYAVDPTNAQLDFTRNYVRHRLLPSLSKKMNPQTIKHLGRLASAAAEINSFVASQARAALRSHTAQKGLRKTILRIPGFLKLDTCLQKEVLFLALERLRGNRLQLGFEHLDSILQLAQTGENGSALDLPGALRVQRNFQTLSLEKKG